MCVITNLSGFGYSSKMMEAHCQNAKPVIDVSKHPTHSDMHTTSVYFLYNEALQFDIDNEMNDTDCLTLWF